MRTTLSLKIPKRSVTPLIAVLLLTGTVSLGTACDDDKDYYTSSGRTRPSSKKR